LIFVVFGYGFIGAAFSDLARQNGHEIIATARTAEKRQSLSMQAIRAIDPADSKALSAALEGADGLLVTSAPTDGGCPAFAVTKDILPQNRTLKIAYLSTTGVYGDARGKWVDEQTPPCPTAQEGRNRLLAEQQWLEHNDIHKLMIFRLPGLYGVGRNVFERLKAGTARAIIKPGHVFSRLHHDDCAYGIWCGFQNPHAQGIYNLCDDEPCSSATVLDFAAQLLGLEPPYEINLDDPAISPKTRRFYQDNKRISNARAKAALGWHLRYPTYREGLKAILKAYDT
jgi:nucleoside-diphosphate-sugar epimerase